MKILLVHPGASMSTADVYTGLHAALLARGHTVWEYALDQRIERAGAYMSFCWRKAGKAASGLQQPTPGDILYRAGEELVARALRVMPDVVLIVSAMYIHPDVLELLRRACLRVAIMFTESPYDDARQWRLLPFADVAWANERTSAREAGIAYLPHAWSPERHIAASTDDDDNMPAHDVVFVGTSFQERIDLLGATDWTGIDLALYGNWSNTLGSRHRLRQFIRGGYVENADAAKLYRRARLGLNLYRTSRGFGKNVPMVTTGESLNPRAYELAATGCFTISDYRQEVEEVFGDLVPTFDGPETLRAVVDRWLPDEAGRARVRAALPGVVREQTWHARAAQMEQDLLGAGIGAGRAQAKKMSAAAQPHAASAGG
jgi:hypothetical protein